MINLKPREFGLEVPPNLKENYQRKKRISLTESDLHRIIKDTIYEVLNDMKNPVVREPNG